MNAFPNPADLPRQPQLPDPLVMFNGERVASREQWQRQRAPELRQLFQHYEYGFLPPAQTRVQAKIEYEDKGAFGGKATLQDLTLTWGEPTLQIHLLLATPNSRKPAPTFLGLNFSGNHGLVSDPRIRIPKGWRYTTLPKYVGDEEQRGKQTDAWNIERSIDRGYAVASFFCGDAVPDDEALARERLKLFRADRRAPAAPHDCATIGAWAWGLHRAVDYLVTDSRIDSKRIAVVGHSRLGKTCLLATALDERIAMAIPSQAGCGGTAPARVPADLAKLKADGRPTAETVKAINGGFPHWFCENYKQFNDAPERLPFDQHALVALCAPRPVLISAATEDHWTNQRGMFEMLVAADPVYRLVTGDGVEAGAMPKPEQLLSSRLGYFLRTGEHAMSRPDWDAWLEFADKWLR